MTQEALELSSLSEPVKLREGPDDLRPHMPEPPAVSLVSIRDVTLPMVAGLESQLDPLYIDILRFRRGQSEDGSPVYHAENHDLRFYVLEKPPAREECRPIGIVTPHLADITETLATLRIEHEYVRGLVAGQDGVLMRDPAGNWMALLPLREIR